MAIHLTEFFESYDDPRLIDVARTTLNSAKAIANGQNPYAIAIDINSEKLGSVSAKYTGFKYMPLMALTFIPLVSMDESGLILTNLIIYIAVSFLIYLLTYQISFSHVVSLFALLLYLSIGLIPSEIFEAGVTDLSAVLYLLIGLVCFTLNPLVSGIFIGFSVSTKLLPGILVVSFCLPEKKRLSYFWGLTIGLAPVFYFLIYSPKAFVENIFIFNITRATDTTSWLHYFPTEVGIMTKFLGLIMVTGLSVMPFVGKPSLLLRCEFIVISILSILLGSPINHRNYQIWWMPILAIVFSIEAFRLIEIISENNHEVQKRY